MDPISLILFGIGSLLIGAYIVCIYLLTIAALVELLDEWATDNYVDEDDVGFVTEAIASGNCTHVEGVWNKRTNKVRGVWKINADRVDSNISSKLNQSKVIVIS